MLLLLCWNIIVPQAFHLVHALEISSRLSVPDGVGQLIESTSGITTAFFGLELEDMDGEPRINGAICYCRGSPFDTS